ncbi:hypothetical protein [Gloeocapsa sp. PCC 73106]|uniref:hypothetical protein n=1 Tax=Gloeocapsa sp. PCC 73106 TaxID=102232 RepID=UPI0002ABC5F2|nr:hypothetical protein [Gloeocapsa sp. PCC 73106]ELR98009.1 hypothetical protein GLO73106DRAFT_00018290 [Gloeocapsa sp. PCC 73106]
MSTISKRDFNFISWSAIVIITIAFWLSGITILDLLVIPSLSSAGMMSQSGFASAGYVLFGIFNHLEIVCAAIILTGILSFRHLSQKFDAWSILMAIALLLIALIDTYLLTPQMSGLGLSLNVFEVEPLMSPMMVYLHQSYWFLDLFKLFACIFLLRYCYEQEMTSD